MNSNMSCCLLFLIASLILSNAQANQTYFVQHDKGWQWYREILLVKKSAKKPRKVASPKPSIIMKALRQQVENARDLAILNPTIGNVGHYIQLQNKVSQQAGLFATRWQQALLRFPSLNYGIEHPTNKLGRDVYFQQQQVQEDAAIKQLFSNTGLFFFYKASCPYCHRFAPIVKSFSEQYHIPVIAISLDGGLLPEFPQARPNQGQAMKFHVTRWPALFAVNPYTQQATPISYGLLSRQDLKTRILMIAKQMNEVEV